MSSFSAQFVNGKFVNRYPGAVQQSIYAQGFISDIRNSIAHTVFAMDPVSRMSDLFENCSNVASASYISSKSTVRSIGISAASFGKSILKQLFESVMKIVDATLGVVVRKVFTYLFDVCESLVAKIPNMSGLFSNGPLLTTIICMVCALSLFYCAYNPWSAKIVTVLYATLTGISIISGQWGYASLAGVMTWLTNSISPSVNFTRVKLDSPILLAQSDSDALIGAELQALGKKALMCAAVLGCIFSGQSISNINLDSMLRKVDSVSKAVKGVEALSVYFTDLWTACCAYLMKNVYGIDMIGEKNVAEIDAMYNEVLGMCSMENQLKIGRDAEMNRRIEYLYTHFMKMRTQYHMNRDVMAQLNTISIPLVQMYNKVVTKNPEANVMRQEPVCIMIGGSTGVGKSFMMEPLSIHLLRICGKYDEKSNGKGAVYSRCFEQEFWDGYSGQPVVIYDDFGQQIDSLNNPNPEFFELIRGVNTFPYNLHSAAIHEKANNPFNAKFIILTTNLTSLQPKSLASEAALVRRVHIYLDVSVIPEVRVGKSGSDYDKRVSVKNLLAYRAQNGLSQSDMSHYRFTLRDLTNSSMPIKGKESMTYDQILVEISLIYKQNYESYEYRMANNKTYSAQPLPEGVFSIQAQSEDVISEIERVRFEESVQLMLKNHEQVVSKIHEQTDEIARFGQLTGECHGPEAFWNRCASLLCASWLKFRSCVATTLNQLQHVSWYVIGGVSCAILASSLALYAYFRKSTCDSVEFEGVKETTRQRHHAEFKKRQERRQESLKKSEQLASSFVPAFVESVTSESLLKKKAVDLESVTSESLLKKRAVDLESVTSESLLKKKGVDLESVTSESLLKKKTVDLESVTSEALLKKKECKLESGRALGTFSTKKRVAHMEAIDELDDETSNSFESVHSQQAYEMLSALSQNMTMLWFIHNVDGEEHRTFVGQCFILGGHVGLINNHYINNINALQKYVDGESYLFWTGPTMSGGHAQRITDFMNTVQDVKRGQIETEFRSFRLPLSYPVAKLVTKYMITSSEIKKIAEGMPIMMGTYVKVGEKFIRTFRSGDFKKIDAARFHERNGESRIYAGFGTTDIDSINGDCGAPYVAATDLIQNRLIGFHFAGNHNMTGGGTSFAFITMEDVMHLFRKQIVASSVTTVEYSAQSLEDSFPLDGSFRYLGSVKQSVVASSKTKLRESIIFDRVVESQMLPAALAPPLKPNGPMLKALKKNALSVYPVNEQILRSAVASYSDKLFSLPVQSGDQKILTYEEACQGIVGDNAYPPLQRSKSAGYPYMLQKGAQGKKHLLGKDEWDFSSPASLQLRKDVEFIIEEASNGVVSDVLFVDTLKDEKRPVEKVLEQKTRAFSASPVHYSIAFRQYFGGFLAHMYRNRLDSECAVGIRAHSREWTRLARLMQSKGDKVVAGDFSNFDGSVNFYIFHEVVNIINAWYGDGAKNALIRRCLWENIEHSRHLLGPYVYQMSHGQPSGNPATAVSNSIYNSLASRYVYGLLMADNGMAKTFNDKVAMIAYGDDNIYNIKDDVANIFHPDAITEAFATIDMTYTDEAKTGGASFKSLNEIGFLKRNFVWCERLKRFVAPLKLQSILEMTNWVKQSTSPKEAVTENAKCAITELYFHDEETYEEWSAKISSALKTEGILIPTLPWEYARDLIAQEDMSLLCDLELAWV